MGYNNLFIGKIPPDFACQIFRCHIGYSIRARQVSIAVADARCTKGQWRNVHLHRQFHVIQDSRVFQEQAQSATSTKFRHCHFSIHPPEKQFTIPPAFNQVAVSHTPCSELGTIPIIIHFQRNHMGQGWIRTGHNRSHILFQYVTD